jgi:hypothetical protein
MQDFFIEPNDIFNCKFINKIVGTSLSKDCAVEKCVISLFKKDEYNWFNMEEFPSVDITIDPDKEFTIKILESSKSVYDRYKCEIVYGNKTIIGYTDIYPELKPIKKPTILLHSSVFLPSLEKSVYLKVINKPSIKIMPVNWTYWV